MATIERPKTHISLLDIEREVEEEIAYEGLNKEQESRISTRIDQTGMPTPNVNEVVFNPEKSKVHPNAVGSYQSFTGKLELYKPLESLPPVAQDSTLVHELAHSNSSFEEKNIPLYGSRENMENAREFIRAVANQTDETHVYLNPYQAYLHRQLEAGEIDEYLFVEETGAIITELRYNDPEHLAEVERAQHAKLKSLEKNTGQEMPAPVDLTTKVDGDKIKLSGMDAALINLLRPKGVNSYQDLENKLQNFRGTAGRKLLKAA